MATHDNDQDPAAAAARQNLQYSLELLWRGLPDTSRGPQRILSLDQIAARGIEVADTDGLEALSMRRLARELNVGTMSLYRYVPNKSVLIDLMLDHVSGLNVDENAEDGDSWRAAVERYAWTLRRRFLKHPWLLEVSGARPVLGPGQVKSLDAFMVALRSIKLSSQQKVMLMSTIDGYIVGTVGQEVQYNRTIAEIGGDEGLLWQTQFPYLEDAMHSGAFPTSAEMDEDSYAGSWEDTFAFGLKLLLDGLADEIARMTSL